MRAINGGTYIREKPRLFNTKGSINSAEVAVDRLLAAKDTEVRCCFGRCLLVGRYQRGCGCLRVGVSTRCHRDFGSQRGSGSSVRAARGQLHRPWKSS